LAIQILARSHSRQTFRGISSSGDGSRSDLYADLKMREVGPRGTEFCNGLRK
jgi:hypothetical protein